MPSGAILETARQRRGGGRGAVGGEGDRARRDDPGAVGRREKDDPIRRRCRFIPRFRTICRSATADFVRKRGADAASRNRKRSIPRFRTVCRSETADFVRKRGIDALPWFACRARRPSPRPRLVGPAPAAASTCPLRRASTPRHPRSAAAAVSSTSIAARLPPPRASAATASIATTPPRPPQLPRQCPPQPLRPPRRPRAPQLRGSRVPATTHPPTSPNSLEYPRGVGVSCPSRSRERSFPWLMRNSMSRA